MYMVTKLLPRDVLGVVLIKPLENSLKCAVLLTSLMEVCREPKI